jgi:large subunit ribosomal protein L13
MSKLHFTTKHANAASVQRKWHVVDGTNQTVGRISSKIASVLRGKNKAYYSPHVDCGDYVIVINAEKVAFSGTKLEDKEYVRFSGYPGGQRFTAAKDMLSKHPERLIEKAVKGMLPKNTLGRQLYRNLKVYKGTEHKHEAQQPSLLNLDTLK